MFALTLTSIIIVTILACAAIWTAQLIIACMTDQIPTPREAILATANGARWIINNTKEVITMFGITTILFILAVHKNIRDFAETMTGNLIGLAKFIAIFAKLAYSTVRDCIIAVYIRVMSFVDITKEIATKIHTATVSAVHKAIEIAKATRWAICAIAKLAVWVFGGMNAQMERDIDALWNAINTAKAICHKAMVVTTDTANAVRWATHAIAKIAVLALDGITVEIGHAIDTACENAAAVYAAIGNTVAALLRNVRDTMLMVHAIGKIAHWIIGGIEAELEQVINTPVRNPMSTIRRSTVRYFRKWKLATRF